MAYISQTPQDDDESKRNQQAALAQMGTPLSSAPSAPAPPSGAPGFQNPTSAPAGGQQGGDFINYSSYLNANRGGANSGLANSLASKVGGEGAGAQQEASDLSSAFSNAVAAGSPLGTSTPGTHAQSSAGATKQAPAQPSAQATTTAASQQNAQAVGHAGASPQDLISGLANEASNQYNAAANQATSGLPAGTTAAQAAQNAQAQYTGPDNMTKLADYQKTQGDTAQAVQDAQALTSTGGIQGLVQQQVPESSGMSALDAALAQNAGGGQFAKLASQYGGLQSALDAANTASAAQADKARAYTAARAAQYANAEPYLAQREANASQAAQAAGDFSGRPSFDEFKKREGMMRTVPGFNQQMYNSMTPGEWADFTKAIADAKAQGAAGTLQPWLNEYSKTHTNLQNLRG